jgi:C-terminal processing protease CtpA/Prc
MARVGQTHPIWLQEGLACLLEDVDVGSDGTLTIRPSWRTNIAKRLAKMGGLTPWERLFTMDHKEFVERRPRAAYAQARAVVMFLQEQGKLVEWYRAYVAGFDEDPTGIKAMETVFAEPSAQVQREYRKWLIDLEEVADVDRPGPSLGVALSQGRGDGPVVDEIVAMNPGGIGGETGNRLRHRDVIVAIDGRTVRTLDDLTRVLGDYEVGDDVVVRVRRGRTSRDVPVTLVAPEE